MTPSKTHKIWERIFSFFLAITFLFSSISTTPFSAFAETVQGSLAPQLIEHLQELPRRNGSIEKIRIARTEKSQPLIIHIQDAHSNPSAQKNIQAILNFLYEKFPNMAVAVEGAAGRLHPEYFDLFSDYPKANQKMIEALAAKGEIAGSELFAWEHYQKTRNGTNSPVLFGIENPELYRTNLKEFRSLLSSRDEIDAQLQFLRSWLTTMESKNLNSDLREFLKEKDRRKDGRFDQLMKHGNSDMGAYFTYIVKQSKNQLGIDLENPIEQFRFPHLVRFLMLQRDAKEANQERAQEEWKELLQQIRTQAKSDTEKALFQSFDFFLRKTLFVNHAAEQDAQNQAAYARSLVEKLARFAEKSKIDLEKFSQAVRSIRLFIFQSEIKAEDLFQEVEKLESGLFAKLAKTEDEKEWANYHEALILLEKLLHLELTHTELIRIQDNESISAMIKESRISRAEDLFRFADQARGFYQTALKRDQALAENALRGIEGNKPDVLVIITGGFHQEGIRRILEERKVPYAVVTPSIAAIESAQLYLEVMAGSHADLSVYFKQQNPFALKREALFFKLLLEEGVPSLIKDYQVASEKLPEILQAVIEKNPLFSNSMSAKLVKEENHFVVNIGPRLEVPSIEPARFTLADALSSSEKFLGTSSSATIQPFQVAVGPEGGVTLQLAQSEVRNVNSNSRISGGLLTPEMIAQVARRSEARMPRSLESFGSFIQAGVRSPGRAIDLSNPDIINPRRKAFETLLKEKYGVVTLEEMAEALNSVEAESLVNEIVKTPPQRNAMKPVMEKLKAQSTSKLVEIFRAFLYLSDSAKLNQEIFGSIIEWQKNPLFIISKPGAATRGRLFEYLAKQALEARTNEHDTNPALVRRSEIRQANIQNDITPTDELMTELAALAATGAGKNLSVLPEAASLNRIAPLIATSVVTDTATQFPIARQWGMIQRFSAAQSDLQIRIQQILGPYARILDPRTPAAHLTVPDSAPADMSEAGLKAYVAERITMFIEGIFNSSSRVNLILPVTRAQASQIQIAFNREAKRLGLSAGYVTVTGAENRQVAAALKMASSPAYKEFAKGLLVFDEALFDSVSFQGFTPLSAQGLDRQLALMIAPERLRLLTADELSRRVWLGFISLEAFSKQLGFKADFEARMRLVVQVLRTVGSAA